MKPHPFAPLWLALFLSPTLALSFEGSQPGQGSQPGCQAKEQSPTFRRALEMTDAEAQKECSQQTGASFDLCMTVVNGMRDSAKETDAAMATACLRTLAPGDQADNSSQQAALKASALKAKEAQDENQRQAEMHVKHLKELRQYRDQMNRNQQGLLADRDQLARIDPKIKQADSTVTGSDPRVPASKANPIGANPSFDDYQLGRMPVPNYTGPRVIDASASGSKNLAEYEQKLPYMIERQNRLLKMMDQFEEETQNKKAGHETAALELGKQAASLILMANKMGNADPSLNSPFPPGVKASEKAPSQLAKEQKREGVAPKPRASATAETDAAKGKTADLAPASVAKGFKPETSEETAMLDSFQSRLLEDGKGKLSMPERSRLRDLLRRQAGAGRSPGESATPGEFAAELLAEAERNDTRAPASVVGKPGDRRGIVRLDVQGALEEIESQLEEMDRSMGILSAESESLFERVKSVHRKSEKSGIVGRRS